MKRAIVAVILSCLCIAACMVPTAALSETQQENRFSDVKPNDWFYDAVRFVLGNSLMVGTSEDSFAPGKLTTRAMLVTVLYRLEGEPFVTDSSPFRDVEEGKWYADAVIWAEANGIVTGFENNLFRPDLEITREQFVTILYRYALGKGYDVSSGADSGITIYKDYGKISDWALSAMNWAYGEGLIRGRSADMLCPKDNTTRAEMAMILMRFLEKDRSLISVDAEEPTEEKTSDTKDSGRKPDPLFGVLGKTVNFPPPTVKLSADRKAVPEGGELTYTATLSRVVSNDLVVVLSNGLTITIPAGHYSSSVTFIPRENDEYRQEDAELTVAIVMVSRAFWLDGALATFNGTPVTAVIYEADDDKTETTVSLSVDKTAVIEAETLTYTAEIENAPKSDLTVTLSNGQTITIEAGKTSGSVSFDTRLNDPYKQGDETLTVSITEVTQDSAADGLEKVTFDDTSVSTVVSDKETETFVSLSVDKQETHPNNTLTYTVKLNDGNGGKVAVKTGTVEVILSNNQTIILRSGESEGSAQVTTGVPTGSSETLTVGITSVSQSVDGTGGFEKLTPSTSTVCTQVTLEKLELTINTGSTLNVYEAGLEKGSGRGTINITGDGEMQLTGGAGLKEFQISYTKSDGKSGSTSITEEGGTVDMQYGSVKFTYEDGSLSYSYKLTGPAMNKNGEPVIESFSVVAKDKMNSLSEEQKVKVNIQDDKPYCDKEDETITITLSNSNLNNEISVGATAIVMTSIPGADGPVNPTLEFDDETPNIVKTLSAYVNGKWADVKYDKNNGVFTADGQDVIALSNDPNDNIIVVQKCPLKIPDGKNSIIISKSSVTIKFTDQDGSSDSYTFTTILEVTK